MGSTGHPLACPCRRCLADEFVACEFCEIGLSCRVFFVPSLPASTVRTSPPADPSVPFVFPPQPVSPFAIRNSFAWHRHRLQCYAMQHGPQREASTTAANGTSHWAWAHAHLQLSKVPRLELALAFPSARRVPARSKPDPSASSHLGTWAPAGHLGRSMLDLESLVAPGQVTSLVPGRLYYGSAS